ncbi:hypothetical protein Tco_0812119 [Tanacetum coccineum]
MLGSIPSLICPILVNNWASALASTYAPPSENSLLKQTGDMAIFMDWFWKKQGITEIKQQDLEGPAYEIVKVFHPNVIHLQYQMEECHKLLTDQVDESMIRVSKIRSQEWQTCIVNLKMKAAYYPNVGLEQMVPDHMWIAEECKYDIAAMHGISHWWFQRKQFYIDRHISEGDHRAVRTHIRILSVVRIEVFSLYGYDYMKKIVLRRADLKEYTIAEKGLQYLYQDKLNSQPRWDATGFEFNHNFTVNDSLRAVTFSDKYGVQMIMRFNEIHKFSDDTLQ